MCLVICVRKRGDEELGEGVGGGVFVEVVVEVFDVFGLDVRSDWWWSWLFVFVEVRG